MLAVLEGNHRLAKVLLDNGARVNARNARSGTTALMFAADFGRLETVQLLLERGAEVNLKNAWGLTALLYAVRSPAAAPEVVEALLDRGADFRVRDPRGGRP